MYIGIKNTIRMLLTLTITLLPYAINAQNTTHLDQSEEFWDKAKKSKALMDNIQNIINTDISTSSAELDKIKEIYKRDFFQKLPELASELAIMIRSIVLITKAHNSKVTEEVLPEAVRSGVSAAQKFAEIKDATQEFVELNKSFAAHLKDIGARQTELDAQRKNLENLTSQAEVAGLTKTLKTSTSPSDIGFWKLQLGEKPTAELIFQDAAQASEKSTPKAFKSLVLTCGTPKGTIVYRAVPNGHTYTSIYINNGGETISEFSLSADGTFQQRSAVQFVAALIPMLSSYDKEKNKEQFIGLMTPDMHEDTINFYGFGRVRNALKEACAKVELLPVVSENNPTMTNIGAREVTSWREVLDIIGKLRSNGACWIPPFSAAAIAGMNQVNEVSCGNSVGTKLTGNNALAVIFKSAQVSTTARIDNPLNTMVLSSITIQIPSTFYTRISAQQIEGALNDMLGPLGYKQYAGIAAAALQRGQNGEEYLPHYIKYFFFNGAAINSPQAFGAIMVLKCGQKEADIPFCH